MPYPGPPLEFTKDKPLRLIVGPNDSGICAISESQPELVVSGTVELHLAFAQEKQIQRVSLVFRSGVFTRISNGEVTFSDEEKPCRDKKIVLWSIGSAFPPPGEHVLRLPFSFPLPANCPPSMQEEEGRHLASISYMLDLHGERNVTFGFDMHIERWVNVIPPNLNIGRLHSTSGRDLVRVARADVRRSVFKHGKGYVDVKLNIPGHNHRPFPIDVRIPFTVTVTTFSIPVCATSGPEIDKDALCPSIDATALHLLLRLGLKRYTTLRVRGASSTKEQTTSSNRALPNFQQKDKLNVQVGPKEWVACTEDDLKLRGKGHWKQQFVFHSSIKLSSRHTTPTFKHTLVDVSYALKLDCIIPNQTSIVPAHYVTIKLPIVISYGMNSVSSTRSASNHLLFVFHAISDGSANFILQSRLRGRPSLFGLGYTHFRRPEYQPIIQISRAQLPGGTLGRTLSGTSGFPRRSLDHCGFNVVIYIYVLDAIHPSPCNDTLPWVTGARICM